MPAENPLQSPFDLNPEFLAEVNRWGPGASGAVPSRAEAESYCRQLAHTHYENFPIASHLLPRHLRQHFYNVYAYCRWADDLGDEVGDAARSLELLGWWKEQLAACYRGVVRHPVFVALRPTIAEFDIPQSPFADLISAFEQDQRIKEYDSFEQLRDYCRRSADPVGRIVLYLCRAYSEQNAIWSDSICTGLQLANFWQDVSRDFEIGRVYLPREDRLQFGYTIESLNARETNESFLRLMRFEVERAADLLRSGLPLVEALPGRMQVDIDLFARGGLQILRRIEDIEFRVWERRPVVSKFDVARLFLGACLRAARRRLASRRPTSPAHETTVRQAKAAQS